MMKTIQMWRWKAVVLSAGMIAGSTFFFSCGLTDIRKNIVAGTLDFVSDYTADIWTGVAPTPPDLFE